jgi:hypothetical protein
MIPTMAKQPPNTPANTFVPLDTLKSSRIDSEPKPIAPKIPANTRPMLPAIKAPTRLPMMPPNTNANHQPVPDGQYGTGP